MGAASNAMSRYKRLVPRMIDVSISLRNSVGDRPAVTLQDLNRTIVRGTADGNQLLMWIRLAGDAIETMSQSRHTVMHINYYRRHNFVIPAHYVPRRFPDTSPDNSAPFYPHQIGSSHPLLHLLQASSELDHSQSEKE